jgi:hypothetical protein
MTSTRASRKAELNCPTIAVKSGLTLIEYPVVWMGMDIEAPLPITLAEPTGLSKPLN